jgi:NADH-quinone oxidoreductase subunit C
MSEEKRPEEGAEQELKAKAEGDKEADEVRAAASETGEARAKAQSESGKTEAKAEGKSGNAESSAAMPAGAKGEPAASAAGATEVPAGEQPAAEAPAATPSEQARAAKENAEGAKDRGVNVNPAEVAEAVKDLTSDAPAPASTAAQASAEGAPAAEAAPVDPEREAKVRAAAEARAARAAAKAAAAGDGAASPEVAAAEKPARAPRAAAAKADDGPKEPSPNQPLLDRVVAILKESVGDDVVEQAYINEMDGHRPYLVIKNDRWRETATVLRDHAELKCDYLRNLSGVDQETHMEVAYYLLSLASKREYAVKVKTDRDNPRIPSVTPIWDTANWNEREVYDLYGIDFPGHPDLRRIMMPDDWVGHPLRKDYEPLDPEV